MKPYRSLQEIIDNYPMPEVPDLSIYYGPPLTESMIARAEEQLGVKLPKAYLDLLRIQNGGYIEGEWFQSAEGVEFECREIPGLGYSQAIDGETGSNYLVEEWEYPDGVVYLTGDGHTAVCFDYRECGPEGEPSMAWIDVECDEEHQIAKDFSEFLEIVSNPAEAD